jgi:hypothetical protein
MAYYILYPKNRNESVKIVHKRPRADYRRYGFAEGPLKSKQAVCTRLNQMNVSASRRPAKFVECTR